MPSDILRFAAEVVLGAAYALIVFTVLKSREEVFKNAIYILFATTGITDIFSIYLGIFFRVVSQIGVDSILQRIISIAVIINGVAFMAHMVGNVIIAINRYSALCLMRNYDMIWTRRNVWVMVGLQYVVAFIAVSPLIGAEIVYTPNTDGTHTFAGLETQADLTNKLTAFGICVVYASVSVIVNIRLAIVWRRLLRLGDTSKYSRQEKSLLLYALCVFISSILMSAFQFLKVFGIYTNNGNLKAWVGAQWYWINDLMVLIPPMFMVMLSAELRKEIANSIPCRNHGNPSTIAVGTHTNQHSILGNDSNTNNGGRTFIVSTY